MTVERARPKSRTTEAVGRPLPVCLLQKVKMSEPLSDLLFNVTGSASRVTAKVKFD